MSPDILKQLAGGDRRSIGKADQVAAQILKNRALLKHIISGFSHADPVVRMRCADVAEKVSAAHPEWLEPHKPAILSFAERAQDKELRWHIARMLPRLKLSSRERRAAIELLFLYLDDASQIVRTFSMQALFDMSDSALRARVTPILEQAVKTGGAAMRARARKLLKSVR